MTTGQNGLTRPWSLALALVGFLVCAVGVQSWRLVRVQRSRAAHALAADTLRASRDTSRLLQIRLGDSLRAVQRLVVQREQASDALDRELKQQRLALAQLSVSLQQLRATVRSAAPTREDSSGTRAASFQVRQPPYTVDAQVTLPPPPGAGSLEIQVAVDSAQLELRLGCTAANAEGIRSAQATVTGPPWLPIRVGRVEQDAGLCRSPALEPRRSLGWRRWMPHLSAGYGLQLTPGGEIRAGWQLGAHVDLWRP